METNEVLVSPADQTVLYMSRRSALRLTMRPRYPLRDPVSGQLTGHTPGTVIAFRDGQVRVPKVGEWSARDTEDAGASEPMPAEDARQWLESHRLFGNRQEGFWRVDPTAPPVSQDEMRALMQAALRLDGDTLREIIRQETEGWGRSQILEEAQTALEQIEAMASQQAEIAEQEAKAEPPVKAKPGPKPKAPEA